jgi:diphosphomevalonate decarboxylase
MKASAIANANIALVKYWGKRDKERILPQNSSISMTTDGLFAHTTVEFAEEYERDIFVLNGEELSLDSKGYLEYVGHFLKIVREIKDNGLRAKIVSKNNFPTAAGLASSAGGFAALAVAINKALDLGLGDKELSMLARRGSGSATRSIMGGFVKWNRGEKDDGTDSFGEQLADESYWPEFRMVFCITSKQEKKIKSRAGMGQTLETCPLYSGWLASIDEDLKEVRDGIINRDFTKVGRIAEYNALKMHATMISTKPSIIYWNAHTINLIQAVMDWRDEGLEAYFTMDAGPQVKIICLEKDVGEVVRRAKEIGGVEEIIVSKPGGPAHTTGQHLF